MNDGEVAMAGKSIGLGKQSGPSSGMPGMGQPYPTDFPSMYDKNTS